jgi:hypothetical protein
MPSVEGLGARRAALQLLDGILRRGQTLETAGAAVRSLSPPVPKPEAANPAAPPDGEEERLDPTRYGDWEKKGIAIDF